MTNPLKQIIRDFSLAIDGILFRGDCDRLTLPELSRKVEEYRGGGMDSPIEVELGYDKKEMMFELTAADPSVVRLVGTAESDIRQFTTYVYTRGFNGEEAGLKIECNGFIKKLDSRELEPGGKVKLKFTVATSYYKETQGGIVTLEHDPLNLRLVVNGVDVYQNRRTLLGL